MTSSIFVGYHKVGRRVRTSQPDSMGLCNSKARPGHVDSYCYSWHFIFKDHDCLNATVVKTTGDGDIPVLPLSLVAYQRAIVGSLVRVSS